MVDYGCYALVLIASFKSNICENKWLVVLWYNFLILVLSMGFDHGGLVVCFSDVV